MSSVRPIDRVLNIVEVDKGPDRNGEYLAFCLAHDDHRTPDLRIGEAEDGRVLLRCFAGCDQERLLTALEERGISRAKLFMHSDDKGGGGSYTSSKTRSTHQPATLENYAAYVGLPV